MFSSIFATDILISTNYYTTNTIIITLALGIFIGLHLDTVNSVWNMFCSTPVSLRQPIALTSFGVDEMYRIG